MARSRSRKLAIGILVVWLIVWTGGMLVVAWGFGTAAMNGVVPALAVMAVWLVAASFGLYAGARKLRRLLVAEDDVAPKVRPQEWADGIADRGEQG